MGAKYKYNTAEDVFMNLSNIRIKGMSYRKIGNRGLMLKQKETILLHHCIAMNMEF